MTYELYYWPGLPGRGEFVRLAFEAVGVDFADKAVPAETNDIARPSFAPPFLVDSDLVIGQVAAILLYLGPKLGLVPDDAGGQIWTHQVQLTIADFVDEIHDTHHPLDVSLYYEDQKEAARKRAEAFRLRRAPKFLSWFETVLDRNRAGPAHLSGDRLCYADLSLFQVVAGLKFAFPNLMARLGPDYPLVMALAARVGAEPNIAAYLASPRRRAFTQSGIFRFYPELDDDGAEPA